MKTVPHRFPFGCNRMIPTLLANMFDAAQTAKPDKFILRGVGRNQMSQRHAQGGCGEHPSEPLGSQASATC